MKDNKKAVEKAMAPAEDSDKEDGTPKRPKKIEPSAADKIKETESRYAANRKEYERLLADENYKDVAFNEENGGLKATHVGHNFDHLKGYYEKTVQEVGYKNGHSVILEKENHNVMFMRNIEGTWDGYRVEMAGAESGTANNIRNALKHCASKPNADIAVIFFPNENFSQENFEKGFAKFKGLKSTSQYRLFKLIYCIGKGQILSIKKPEL